MLNPVTVALPTEYETTTAVSSLYWIERLFGSKVSIVIGCNAIGVMLVRTLPSP